MLHGGYEKLKIQSVWGFFNDNKFAFYLTPVQAKIVRSTVDSDIFFNLLEKVKLLKEERMLSLLDQVLSPDKTLQDEGLRKWQESSAQLDEVRNLNWFPSQFIN